MKTIVVVIICVSMLITGCATQGGLTQPNQESNNRPASVGSLSDSLMSSATSLPSASQNEGPPEPGEDRVYVGPPIVSRWDRVKHHVSDNRVWYIGLALLAVALTQTQHLKQYPVEHNPTDIPKCGIQTCSWQQMAAGMCPINGPPYCEP